MLLGQNGTALIQGFERLVLTAYLDSGGVPTIGWGHTKGVQLGDICTIAQADAWFNGDTAEAVNGVNATVTVPLNQNEFDALVAFTFNVGVGSEAHSTLIKCVNAGDFMDAAAEFPKWNHVGGVVSLGLTRRRAAERALFLQPIEPTNVAA